MITGLLRLRVLSPLSAPVTTPSVAGWLFAARFWSRPAEASRELDQLEAGGTLALAAPCPDGFVPRPAVPILASGTASKALGRATQMKWDLRTPLRPLKDGDAGEHLLEASERPFLRPRLKMDRALGTVSSDQGFFHVSGVHTAPELIIPIQTNLWDSTTLETLCAVCSELGFGGRKSQGWGHVNLAFEAGPLPDPGEAPGASHLLLFGDAWPGLDGPATGAMLHTRVHRGAGQQGPFKPLALLMAPGSLLPLASPVSSWQVIGTVLRSGLPGDSLRPLVCAQALAWPVQADLPVEVTRAAG